MNIWNFLKCETRPDLAQKRYWFSETRITELLRCSTAPRSESIIRPPKRALVRRITLADGHQKQPPFQWPRSPMDVSTGGGSISMVQFSARSRATLQKGCGHQHGLNRREIVASSWRAARMRGNGLRPVQNVTKQQARGSFTHVVMVCDDPTV